MAKDFDDLTAWRESGIRAVVKDEINQRLGVSQDSADDYTSHVQRLITQRIDEYHASHEDEKPNDDYDVEVLKRIFQRYPKSIIWMLSGLLIGIGTGRPFLVVGIYGAILAFGWLVRSDT